MDKKYLIISLSSEYGKKISEDVANKLGLYFLCLDDYIEYSLFNSEDMMQVCGKDYYLHREQSAIKSCLCFENMLFNCSYDIFSNNEKLFFKNVEIIYLTLTKQELTRFNDGDNVVNQISFQDRDKYLRKHCVVVESNLQKQKECVKNIIDIIRTKL